MTEETIAERPRPGRRTLILLVAPIIGLIVASQAGDLLTTTWAEDHPLALTMLNSRNRILVLTTNQMDAFSYYTTATIRLLLSDPLFYLLGVFYGDAAVQWVERRSASFGEQLRWFEKAFKKASYPLVFLAPNNIICLFSGAAGMKIRTFFILNVSGTIVRLYLIRRLGEAFDEEIQNVLDFFARYRLQLFIVSVILIGFTVWNDRRKGKDEIGGILELEHELEKDGDA